MFGSGDYRWDDRFLFSHGHNWDGCNRNGSDWDHTNRSRRSGNDDSRSNNSRSSSRYNVHGFWWFGCNRCFRSAGLGFQLRDCGLRRLREAVFVLGLERA